MLVIFVLNSLVDSVNVVTFPDVLQEGLYLFIQVWALVIFLSSRLAFNTEDEIVSVHFSGSWVKYTYARLNQYLAVFCIFRIIAVNRLFIFGKYLTHCQTI